MSLIKKACISQFMAPDPGTLGPHTFLHRTYTSGVKITPVLKKSYVLHKAEKVKNSYWENNYNLRK